ncbi:MAG: cobalt chelatase [Dehalococcoidia bacterium]|nr:MAG: cobalt chelatase [Dehalococcoidia bacterium]
MTFVPLDNVSAELSTLSRARATRNIVTRSDGKLVNVARHLGQLFVCVNGCCCGDTTFGAAPSRREIHHAEWERRRMRNRVHLNEAGCLGPCPLANVVMLLLAGHTTFFHSMNAEWQVLALWDYIERQVKVGGYLPPPPELAEYAFNAFSWEGGAQHDLSKQIEVSRVSTVAQSGFLFLTQADTDLLALSRAVPLLDAEFPPVRAFTVNHLLSEADAIAFFDHVVPEAEVVVVRLHGGRASLPGFDYLMRLVEQHGQWLIAMPGTEDLDPELTAYSNAGVPITHEVKAYLQYSGVDNYQQALYFLSDHLLASGYGYLPPIEQLRTGVYHPSASDHTIEAWLRQADLARPTFGVLFYRSYLLTGNTAFIDAMIEAGEAAGANVLPVFAYSLKDEALAAGGLPEAFTYFVDAAGAPRVDVVINTMAFAMGSAGDPVSTAGDQWSVAALERLGVPQLQVVAASTSVKSWQASEAGLTPLDVAMNIAIPELDGRIITVPLAFKQPAATPRSMGHRLMGTQVLHHAPLVDRVERVIGIAMRLAMLRRKPNAEKRVAVMLTNHNAKASRIANAVGLDSPASLLALLHRMRDEGYAVEGIPPDSDALMHLLIDRGHYDRDLLTLDQMRGSVARVATGVYRGWFETLPAERRTEVEAQWGLLPGRHYVDDEGGLTLAGLEFGNVFVAVQPPRGYGMDKTAIMHRPDLPPPHPYVALYRWLAEGLIKGGWGADVVVHMGKHGSLEWLPGKGVGLSEDCFPDLLLGDLPLVYPFIVDDPGEGAAAKRRAHAVIIDHLPPPMTTAGAYGPLAQIDRLVDEYYLLERTDPAKLPFLQVEIWQVIKDAHLDTDLSLLLNADGATANHIHVWDPATHEDGVPYSLSDLTASDFRHLVEAIHAYTHELGTAPIRDGLHILGRVLDGNELVEMLAMLTRLPNGAVPSLRDGLARAFGLDLDTLLDTPGAPLTAPPALEALASTPINDATDALDAIDAAGRAALHALASADFAPRAVDAALHKVFGDVGNGEARASLAQTLDFVCSLVVPGLRRAGEELDHLIDALSGRYVLPGPSGAPTRGMAHVLPTGRNFYSIDPRVVPSPTAWQTGQLLAQGLIDRYVRDEGRYPESVGLSIWGTSAMRTQGDDIAQVLALMGVRPRWQAESRRVVGLEVLSLAELGRPRVDVICRISGFFRDAFPHAITLFDEAVELVSNLDESPEDNYVRRNRLRDRQRLREAGATPEQAWIEAGYRVFGSPPGTYGAGILPLIDERQWRSDADFAATYVNWGGYAYTREAFGVDARARFREVLASVQVAAKNQDNREHDIFDSDDYLQFHGGMIATIRSLTGTNPRRYFGDSQDPARPRVHDLREEALRVFRSRVLNPKWLESIRQHGYKGGLEVAATVDYLFGYDATADVLDDWMYAEVARAYALDPTMQAFLQASNPWATTDIATRLIEAIDRGMWEAPDPELRAALEDQLLAAESAIEGRGAYDD